MSTWRPSPSGRGSLLRSGAALGVLASTMGLAALAACSGTTDQPGATPGAPPDAAPAEPAASEPNPGADISTGTMNAHFDEALSMRLSVVQGDLDGAKRAAASLVAQLGDSHGEQAVAAAAEGVANASELAEAAKSTAKVAAACGDCHASAHIELKFPEAPDPGVGGQGASSHMQRHQWAAEQLWRGLVGNYEMAWARGGAGLAESALHEGELDEAAGASVEGEVVDLANRVHVLGGQAREATDPAARVDIFGELLVTCSSCHAKTGGS